MADKNYTNVDELVKKKKEEFSKQGFYKEAEPIGEKFEIKEVVEHRVEDEVQPFISPRKETIEIPPDLKKMGLQSTSSSQFNSYQNIQLPIADEKVVVGLSAPVTSSIRWLATLAVYLLSRAHLGLKVIHGKVVRVLKP